MNCLNYRYTRTDNICKYRVEGHTFLMMSATRYLLPFRPASYSHVTSYTSQLSSRPIPTISGHSQCQLEKYRKKERKRKTKIAKTMSVHLHNPPRLLSPLSNRKKWGKSKQHHILASNSLRASLTNQLPFPSLFPFPVPPPFTPIHHSTTHHRTRKSASAGSLSMQAKQASKRPCRFRKISKFSYWCNTTYKSFIYRYTYLQALRYKVFWSNTSHAYGFIRSFSRPSCEGRLLFDTMHAC